MKEKNKKESSRRRGFTLIELLIVIAIIAIIAGVVFVALDPLKRFRDSRDARRTADAQNILNAIKIDQVDNRGSYISAVSGLTAGEVYMIVDGSTATGCDDQNANCDTDVDGDTNCADLSGLVTEGYLGRVPVSPDGAGTWASTITGYTIQKDTTGIITIRACESENSDEIYVVR